MTEMATDETPIDGTKASEESPIRSFLTGSIVGSIGTGMNKLLRRPDETTPIDETTEKDIASDVKVEPHLRGRGSRALGSGRRVTRAGRLRTFLSHFTYIGTL